MANPLFQQFGNQMPGQMGNFTQQFQAFKQQFRGVDPKQELERRMQAGQISQGQVNQAIQMARGMGLFK